MADTSQNHSSSQSVRDAYRHMRSLPWNEQYAAWSMLISIIGVVALMVGMAYFQPGPTPIIQLAVAWLLTMLIFLGVMSIITPKKQKNENTSYLCALLLVALCSIVGWEFLLSLI